MKPNVGIVGVTGYSGQELLRLLLRHPGVSLRYLAARQLEKPTPVGSLLPRFKGLTALEVHPFKAAQARQQCDFVFLALPNGVAMRLLPALLKKPGLRVVDLSGDFRLRDVRQFAQSYHLKHAAPTLLKRSVYGLPEWNRNAIAAARWVANPGCYPTAALLGLYPLAKKRWLAARGTIIDAKSGVTGAGRALKPELLFCEVNEELHAYRVGQHQHAPEMEQALSDAAGRALRLTFVPHLVPMNRGLYVTAYAPLKRVLSERELYRLYETCYAPEPFVRLLAPGEWPKTTAVRETNFCDVAVTWDAVGKRAIVLTAIDNLGKGAAGQAIQNMNLMLGFDETDGLL